MERYFERTQKICLSASPFDSETISELFRKPEVCYWLLVQYSANVIDYSITEITDPDVIASAVGDEVAEIKGQAVLVNRIGDNGENDLGYEIVNGKRCIIDIGIMRCMDGVWYVVVDRAENHSIPIDSADDLREMLK